MRPEVGLRIHAIMVSINKKLVCGYPQDMGDPLQCGHGAALFAGFELRDKGCAMADRIGQLALSPAATLTDGSPVFFNSTSGIALFSFR